MYIYYFIFLLILLAASVTQAENTFPCMVHQFPCCLLCEPLWIRATSITQAVANSEPLQVSSDLHKKLRLFFDEDNILIV